MNSGQVCFAAKRFLVHKSIEDDFIKKLETKVKEMKVGDPMEEDTQIGPFATQELYRKLEDQFIRGIGVLGEDGEKVELLFGGEGQEETNTWQPTAVRVPATQAPLHLNFDDDKTTLSEQLHPYHDNQK